MTTIKVNGDRISAACGNRGGIHKSVAYAGVEAIKAAMSLTGDVGIFGDDELSTLSICRWRFATGTHRAEPTQTLYVVAVERDDAMTDAVAASGKYADLCLDAMRAELAKNVHRIQRRGNESVASSDPLDVGFDPKLHRVM